MLRHGGHKDTRHSACKGNLWTATAVSQLLSKSKVQHMPACQHPFPPAMSISAEISSHLPTCPAVCQRHRCIGCNACFVTYKAWPQVPCDAQ
eukprot:scaffold34640_cov21-Tisochrysis_lutea.AAC.1